MRDAVQSILFKEKDEQLTSYLQPIVHKWQLVQHFISC